MKLKLPRPIVFQFDVSDDVARRRLKERQGPEDKPELIEERLKNYHREMDVICAYYPEVKIWTINTDMPVAEVSRMIEGILKEEMPKR